MTGTMADVEFPAECDICGYVAEDYVDAVLHQEDHGEP